MGCSAAVWENEDAVPQRQAKFMFFFQTQYIYSFRNFNRPCRSDATTLVCPQQSPCNYITRHVSLIITPSPRRRLDLTHFSLLPDDTDEDAGPS